MSASAWFVSAASIEGWFETNETLPAVADLHDDDALTTLEGGGTNCL